MPQPKPNIITANSASLASIGRLRILSAPDRLAVVFSCADMTVETRPPCLVEQHPVDDHADEEDERDRGQHQRGPQVAAARLGRPRSDLHRHPDYFSTGGVSKVWNG